MSRSEGPAAGITEAQGPAGVDKPQAPPPAGWHVSQFYKAAGTSKTVMYTMPKHLRPESVAIGRRRIIIDHPADWLRRMKAAEHGAEAVQ